MYTAVPWKKDKLRAVYEKDEHWKPMLPRDATFESIETMMSKLSEILDYVPEPILTPGSIARMKEAIGTLLMTYPGIATASLLADLAT